MPPPLNYLFTTTVRLFNLVNNVPPYVYEKEENMGTIKNKQKAAISINLKLHWEGVNHLSGEEYKARGFPILMFAENFSLILFDLKPFTLTKNYLSDKNFMLLRRVENRNKYVKKYGQNKGFSVFLHITVIQIN